MREKEFLYVGHYIDTNGNFILKVGTTNNLERRKREHTRNYRKATHYTMPENSAFTFDWIRPLSKYNTLRYEDKTREAWQAAGVGEYVRNDRFNCGKCAPQKLTITIRKTFTVEFL